MNDIEKAAARLRLQKKEGVGGNYFSSDEGSERSYPLNHDTDSAAIQNSKNGDEQIGSNIDQGLDEMGTVRPLPMLEPNVLVAEQPTTLKRESAGFESGKQEAILELPLRNLLLDGFLVPDTPKGRMTEEYRRIKRPLLKNLAKESRPDNSNIVMITSSVTGEGKTYTAINLAMSFALERDRTVLLIDADVIKGSAGKILEVSPSALGLTDLLAGDCSDMGQAVLPTNVPSLSFMPAGSLHENTNELLSSSNMTLCINELAEQYSDRIIVVDSSPLLQTNEANILAEHAGQIVFVVAEADTPQKLVTQALDHIDKDKYVGILLNKSNAARHNYGYGYAYGYE